MSPTILSFVLLAAAAPPMETQATPKTQVYVRTTPPGAKIVVDGKPRGTSPDLFDVPPGVRKMTIEVELLGHHPKKRQVRIDGGQITRVILEGPGSRTPPANRVLPTAETLQSTDGSLPFDHFIGTYAAEQKPDRPILKVSANDDQGRRVRWSTEFR